LFRKRQRAVHGEGFGADNRNEPVRGHGPPDPRGGGAPLPEPPGGDAPLSRVARHRRQGAAPCGTARGRPGGAGRLAPRLVRLGARDRWIGRSDGQRVRRRRLVADNCRFAALVPGKVPNLASRVPGPCQHDMVGVRCKTPFLRLRGQKSGSDLFERRVSGAGAALSGADSV